MHTCARALRPFHTLLGRSVFVSPRRVGIHPPLCCSHRRLCCVSGTDGNSVLVGQVCHTIQGFNTFPPKNGKPLMTRPMAIGTNQDRRASTGAAATSTVERSHQQLQAPQRKPNPSATRPRTRGLTARRSACEFEWDPRPSTVRQMRRSVAK